MINIDKAFHDSRKNIIERFYNSDLIHFTSSATKRLLNAINYEKTIVKTMKIVYLLATDREKWEEPKL